MLTTAGNKYIAPSQALNNESNFKQLTTSVFPQFSYLTLSKK